MEQHRKRYKDNFAVPLSICAFSINIKPYKWSHLSDVVTTSPHTSSLEAWYWYDNLLRPEESMIKQHEQVSYLRLDMMRKKYLLMLIALIQYNLHEKYKWY
jgi:hypothetical protein